MIYQEFGVILFVERYDECVDFYKDKLQLPVRKVKEDLVTFNVGNGYFMVERDGFGSDGEKNRKQNPTVIRFNSNSLRDTVSELKEQGVRFIEEELAFDWGTIAVFVDPDGNRIEINSID